MIKRFQSAIKARKNNILIGVLLLLMFTAYGRILIEDYRIVACVGDKRIYEKDIDKIIDEEQRESMIKDAINNELIDIAFEDNKLSITDEELEVNLNQMKLFNYTLTTLEDAKTKKLVERYSKVKKLATLYVIKEADLKEYIKGLIENDGDEVFSTVSIYADDDDLQKMYSASGERDIKGEAEKNGYKMIRRDVLSKNNYYNVDLSTMSEGECFLYDGRSNIDEDIYSNKKALVLIENVDDATKTLFNLQKNRKEIEDRYFNKNYYELRLSLVNRLQGEYSVKIK